MLPNAGLGVVADRLVVDLDTDGSVSVSLWMHGELAGALTADLRELLWPLDGDAPGESALVLGGLLAARSTSSPGRSTPTSSSGSTTSSSSSNRRPRGRWTASQRRSSCGPADSDRSVATHAERLVYRNQPTRTTRRLSLDPPMPELLAGLECLRGSLNRVVGVLDE